MLDLASTLDVIAELFEYPAAGYREHLESAAASIARTDAAAAEHVQAFADAVRGRSLSEMEELYIQTFDLNPDACLDIGWHLFGEDYARGEFLVKLRQEMRRRAGRTAGQSPHRFAAGRAYAGRRGGAVPCPVSAAGGGEDPKGRAGGEQSVRQASGGIGGTAGWRGNRNGRSGRERA